MGNAIADWFGNAVGTGYYYIAGGTSAEKQGQTLDQKLAELNARKYEAGDYSEENYQQVLRNQGTGATGNVLEQLRESSREGANAGLQGFKAGFWEGIKGVLGVVPWPVYVALAIWLFVWMGGLSLVKGSLAKGGGSAPQS